MCHTEKPGVTQPLPILVSVPLLCQMHEENFREERFTWVRGLKRFQSVIVGGLGSTETFPSRRLGSKREAQWVEPLPCNPNTGSGPQNSHKAGCSRCRSCNPSGPSGMTGDGDGWVSGSPWPS